MPGIFVALTIRQIQHPSLAYTQPRWGGDTRHQAFRTGVVQSQDRRYCRLEAMINLCLWPSRLVQILAVYARGTSTYWTQQDIIWGHRTMLTIHECRDQLSEQRLEVAGCLLHQPFCALWVQRHIESTRFQNPVNHNTPTNTCSSRATYSIG